MISVISVISVNGEMRDYGGQTLSEIIAEHGLDPTRPGIAVAVNGAVAPRAEWSSLRLKAEDRVEIVQAKTGG